MSSAAPTITAACHCRANVFALPLPSQLPIDSDLCHCGACRRVTGSAFASCVTFGAGVVPLIAAKGAEAAVPISADSPPSTLTRYTSGLERLFCKTCGAHVLLFFPSENKWYVAGGTLEKIDGVVRTTYHIFVGDTIDGGITRRMTDKWPRYTTWPGTPEFQAPTTIDAAIAQHNTDTLKARCHCGNVRLTIERPSSNPENESTVKYRAKDGSDRWTAALCLCTSCRLTSGMPLNGWAFIPKAMVDIHPETTLVTYKSSPRVERSFCGTCGATVIYASAGRPDCYDIATGLFDDEGLGCATTEQRWLEYRPGAQAIDFADDALDTWLKDMLLEGKHD